MTDTWASVVPSVVASVVTTLATLGITNGLSSVSRRRRKKQFPILLKRGAGDSFQVINQSRRPFGEFGVQIATSDGGWRAASGYLPTSIYPQQSGNIDVLAPGEVVWFNWTEFRHKRVNYMYSEIMRVREGVDEYMLRRVDDPPTVGG
ncbi:hypothetical protein GCM10022240_27160 [Microbacterium kribbense]|uniref:Uncharacterized protein n=1 Tax=Microbacterium kribbense TaxID=433645 RepID=A0ABP7GTB5_9MICO